MPVGVVPTSIDASLVAMLKVVHVDPSKSILLIVMTCLYKLPPPPPEMVESLSFTQLVVAKSLVSEEDKIVYYFA